MKPISNDRADQMRADLIDGLAYKFIPHIKVQECVVEPDYERGAYNILIRGYCPSLKVSIYKNVTINSLGAD
jgi:hypothetical protein